MTTFCSRSMKAFVEAILAVAHWLTEQCRRVIGGHICRVMLFGMSGNVTNVRDFAQWGLDIVGPLPRAPGNKKFLIVATDYFTKWIEAEPLSHIQDVDAKRFLWRSVVTRFGIPWAVISNNGTQFDGKVFKGFYSDLGIRNFFSSSAYPQANGQAKVSNKVILDGIKKRLEEAKGKWVEELLSVMWTH